MDKEYVSNCCGEFIPGYPDSDIMARALAQAPFGLMNKPFNESDIITAVNTFIPVSMANSAH